MQLEWDRNNNRSPLFSWNSTSPLGDLIAEIAKRKSTLKSCVNRRTRLRAVDLTCWENAELAPHVRSSGSQWFGDQFHQQWGDM